MLFQTLIWRMRGCLPGRIVARLQPQPLKLLNPPTTPLEVSIGAIFAIVKRAVQKILLLARFEYLFSVIFLFILCCLNSFYFFSHKIYSFVLFEVPWYTSVWLFNNDKYGNNLRSSSSQLRWSCGIIIAFPAESSFLLSPSIIILTSTIKLCLHHFPPIFMPRCVMLFIISASIN